MGRKRNPNFLYSSSIDNSFFGLYYNSYKYNFNKIVCIFKCNTERAFNPIVYIPYPKNHYTKLIEE